MCLAHIVTQNLFVKQMNGPTKLSRLSSSHCLLCSKCLLFKSTNTMTFSPFPSTVAIHSLCLCISWSPLMLFQHFFIYSPNKYLLSANTHPPCQLQFTLCHPFSCQSFPSKVVSLSPQCGQRFLLWLALKKSHSFTKHTQCLNALNFCSSVKAFLSHIFSDLPPHN